MGHMQVHLKFCDLLMLLLLPLDTSAPALRLPMMAEAGATWLTSLRATHIERCAPFAYSQVTFVTTPKLILSFF